MNTIQTAADLFAALQQLAPEERARFAALYNASPGSSAVVLQLVMAKVDDAVDMEDEEADLSAEDAADYLGVSAQVLRRYIKAGQIKAARGRPGSAPMYPMDALRDLKSSLKR